LFGADPLIFPLKYSLFQTLTMEAQRAAGKASRASRLELGMIISMASLLLLEERKETMIADKRKIEKLEAVIQSGRSTRVKVDALDKLKKEVDALETTAPKAGSPPTEEKRVTRHTPITCRTYGPDRGIALE
jgi:hypothetical protein